MSHSNSQSLSNSAIAGVSSNQPSYSYGSTAALVSQCVCFTSALTSLFINQKESTMSSINLSTLSVVLSVYSSVSIILPIPTKTMTKRSRIAKTSRRINQLAARAARHRRQARNGWAKSPAYQALCRQQRRFIPVLPAVVVTPAQSTKTVINFKRLSDGDGVYDSAPAVRVHCTFSNPVTASARRQSQLAAREGMELPNQTPVLAKALKDKRKQKARVKSLTASPVARPRDVQRAQKQLIAAERKANRLAEQVRALSEKKGKRKGEKAGVSAGVETPETVDTFLEQLEALKTAIDVNLYQDVAPISHAQQAEARVADYKAAAEATGTADLKMSHRPVTESTLVTLKPAPGVSGMELVVPQDNKIAINNILKGTRRSYTWFCVSTCKVAGVVEYLLSLGFQAHRDNSDWLWLDKDVSVKPINGEPRKKKEKSKEKEETIVQNTATRPVSNRPTEAKKPAATNCSFPARSISTLSKKLPQTTINKLNLPEGLRSLFFFNHQPRVQTPSEIGIFAVNVMMKEGRFIPCNVNIPSVGFDAAYSHYYENDLHPQAKNNIMSGAAVGTGLPYEMSPLTFCVANYCIEGRKVYFMPASWTSLDLQHKTANQQLILDLPDALWCADKAIPGVVAQARQDLRSAMLTGTESVIDSITVKTNSKGEEIEEREVSAKIRFGDDSPVLGGVLADGKRHTLIIVAGFEKQNVVFKENGGRQYRIYPHTAAVLLVEDSNLIFGGNDIFNFCPYKLLGIENPTATTTVTLEETVKQEVTATQPQATRGTQRPVAEVKAKTEAIASANASNELEALYRAVNLVFDTKKPAMSSEELAALKKKHRRGSYDNNAAKITIDYILHRTSQNPVQYYSWTPEDVEDVLDLLSSRWNKESNTATLSYFNTPEGLNINFGGTTAILISTDGRAYDEAGRSFEQAVEVTGHYSISKKKVLVDNKYEDQEVKTPVINGVKPASSTGKFMQAFLGFLLMLSNNKNGVRDGLAANFPELLRAGDDMFPLTLTEVLDQNGGFLHGLQNNMKVLIHKPFNSNVVFTQDQTGQLGRSAANLMRGHLKGKGEKEVLKDSDVEVEKAVMALAMSNYKSLGFHFAKGVFLAGITHVSLHLAQLHAPNLFNRMLLATGKTAEEAADYVVSLTLKASKGAKRATLSMAKAVNVVGEVEAGYRYYNQTKLLKGWLVQECIAPTFVMPPGIALFLGTETEKPTAYFKKTERLVFADYTGGEQLTSAVTLKGQSRIEDRLSGSEPTYSFDSIKGVHTLTFEQKPVVLFGTALAWIPKEVGVWSSVEFKKHDKADLAEIRWFEVQTVGKATELAVEYDYYLTHRNPKLRGIIKAMMGGASPQILYNAMNPDLNALGLGDIKLIAPQDTIKSDMLYSWLQVIGNTLRYSNPEAEAIKRLHEFKEQIHAALGLEANLPYLVIEQYNVVAELYQEMINYFEAAFGRAIWMHVAQCGDQGRIMTELYLRKLATQAGWVNVESSSGWGTEELALYYRLQAEGKTMCVLAESLDYAKDPKQNAMILISKDDEVVEYYQRSYCFIGAQDAPVYGVELFESSTVAEAISDSRHMAPSVRSFSRMSSATLDAAKKLLDAGKEKMYMSLVIAGMASGDTFGCSRVIKFNSVKFKDAKSEIDCISLQAGDIAYIKELLAADDLDALNHEKDLFKSVAHCFRDVVFEVEGKKLWLPALLAIASLKSEDSSNNISQKFFRDILVPCLEGKNPVTLEGKRVKGILDSLCETENTKKLASAATNVTAKRIALPHIPTEEIWVLYSSAPNSICQKLKRSDFDIDKIMSGEVSVFTHNSRAPLTDGPILKLRIIKDTENKGNFYQINSDVFALGAMSNAMDFGDYDGDGHYILQLEGKFEPTTFADNDAFVSNAMGFGMFNVYANKANEKSNSLNESYAADHYNIKSWKKVAMTLSGMPAAIKSKKVTLPLAEYIDFNQKAREVQAKAVGIAYSIFMWSEHLVDILVAAQKVGIDIEEWKFGAAADANLVAPISQMYEIILGGYSPEAWTIYDKYIRDMKDGERTVGRQNIEEFNRDLTAMGVAGDKSEGFLKLMLAAHQLFFLEKHGKFCNNILSNGVPSNMPVPENIKQMLAVALVSFELLRGKFAGFNGVLADNTSPKAQGHKVAMMLARKFLQENPQMIEESLVCYQLNQVVEECDWLLYGAASETRGGRPAAEAVAASRLQPHQLQYFLDLAASKEAVEVEVGAVNNEPEVETVEAVVETISWIEADIVVTEEDDAASTERFFLLDEEVWEHEHRGGVYTFHNQKEWTAFLNLNEEVAGSAAYAEEFTNARLVRGRFVSPQKAVETTEVEAVLPVELTVEQLEAILPQEVVDGCLEFTSSQEEYENYLVLSIEEERAIRDAQEASMSLIEGLIYALAEQPVENLERLIADLDIDTSSFAGESSLEEFQIEIAVELANNAEFYASEETIVKFVKSKLEGYNPTEEEEISEETVEQAPASEVESIVIEEEAKEEAHSVLEQLDKEVRALPADRWVDVLSFVRGLVAEVTDGAVAPVVVELPVVEPVMVEEPTLTEEEQNAVEAQEASVFAFDSTFNRPERKAATSSRRPIAVIAPVVVEDIEEKQPALSAILPTNKKNEEGGSTVVKATRPKNGGSSGAAVETSVVETKTNNRPPATSSRPKATVDEQFVARATVPARDIVQLSLSNPLDWITPYLVGLEPWTANKITTILEGLNPEQQNAVRLVIGGGNYVLTGDAGTGKSYTSSAAIEILKLLGYKIVPVATTGLASMGLRDSQGTINRAAGVGQGFEKGSKQWSEAQRLVAKLLKDPKVKKRFAEEGYKGVIFLIDEISMLDTCLGYVIAEGLEIMQRDEAARKKPRKKAIQWLGVGDFKQLEPVGGLMIMEPSTFEDSGSAMIEPSLIEKLDMKLINLKEQMRQPGDSTFAKELHLLALGKGGRGLANCPSIKARFTASLKEMPEDALHVFALNDELNKFNTKKLNELKAKGNSSRVYTAYIDARDCSEDELLKFVTPIPKRLELAVGAPIRVKQNIEDPSNPEKFLAANGSRGTVVRLLEKSIEVRLRDGRLVEIAKVSVHVPKNEQLEPIGVFMQIPVCLAWGTTFHGCQGLTEDKIVIHAYTREGGKAEGAMKPMFNNNAFYVGCSRVREVTDLFFYTGCDEVNLDTETDEELNWRAGDYRRFMLASYRTNMKVITWLKEQAIC